MSAVRRVPVPVATAPYEVTVGRGVLSEAGRLLGTRRRAAIVSEPVVAERYAGTVRASLTVEASEVFLVRGGEPAKSLATVEDLCRRFARWGLLRDDAVVALGGGVVGDTVGFAAAVYHRGVAVVQAPTTLLAQVDAAIGGKTGVNLPEGKNLVGAFHQPLGVLADVETLGSLPEREFRSGLAEVAKYALMGDAGGSEAVREILRTRADAVCAREPDALTELVASCAAIKAAVVAADERERSGARAMLNYGHTLAHALETTADYTLTHGEAVAIGLVFAAELANALERIPRADVAEHEALLARLGLPTRVPVDGAAIDATELVEHMRRDKKAHGGLTFVLPGPSGLERVDDPAATALEHAFRAVGVGARAAPPSGMGG